jgi:hypothetical protein
MELFNKYKNKDFTYITNYINSCINDPDSAISPDEMAATLMGTSHNTFKEIINALLNKNGNGLDPQQPNADLFFTKNKRLLPIRNNYVPIRLSVAEKAWLFYILQDEKAQLFLDNETINNLITELQADLSLPVISKCIDIRNLGAYKSNALYSEENKASFKAIIHGILTHKELIVTNTKFGGEKYENQIIIPYKLEYSPQFNSFSLSAFLTDAKRPIKMNLLNLSNVQLGEHIQDYEKFVVFFEEELTKIRVKEPITIEIQNDKNGYDRCSYKFASFDRICYENEEGNLIMNIYYYRFQKDEILRNLMFLGPTVKIIAPSHIQDEYILNLKLAYEKYNH